MSMLDDTALVLGIPRVARPTAPAKGVGVKVRFRNGSELARDFGISTTAVGVVCGFYEQDGERRAVVNFGEFGYVTGAKLSELRRASTDP